VQIVQTAAVHVVVESDTIVLDHHRNDAVMRRHLEGDVVCMGVSDGIAEEFSRHRDDVVRELIADNGIDRACEPDGGWAMRRPRDLADDIEKAMTQRSVVALGQGEYRRSDLLDRIVQLIDRLAQRFTGGPRTELPGEGLQAQSRAEDLLDDVIVQVARDSATIVSQECSFRVLGRTHELERDARS